MKPGEGYPLEKLNLKNKHMGINIGTATLLAKTNLLNAVKRASKDNSCSVLMQGLQWMSTNNSYIVKIKDFAPSVRAFSRK